MRGLLRNLAIAWLVVLAPADMATTFVRLLPRLLGDASHVALVLLVAARLTTVAVGTVVGVALWRRDPAAQALSRIWVPAECLTLALVWSTTIVPTNRAPGTLLPLVVVYVGMAALVFNVARSSPHDA